MITTKQELLDWLAERYYADWEIERAQAVADRDGLQAGIEYLVKGDLGRGYTGPGNPTYFMRKAKEIQCYYPGSDFVTQPPDVVIPCATLARRVLDDPRQPRLL